ncbi:MAG: metal ABC transporter permease [Actinobacteria bacterium]|nr:metal ABC transporter permease [Actinomycetota bacterium]
MTAVLHELFVAPAAQYEFMRYALAAVAVVGVTSATLSCLLVVRHQALLGDAVSHAVLPGVAVGWLAAGHLGIFWGALAAALLAGVAITFVERRSTVKLDAVMGIVFTFAFALGLAVISVARPRGIDLFHVLLGNVLGVGRTDLLLTAGSGGLVLLVVVGLYRHFHLWSFDPVMARAVGLRVGTLNYVFTALLSATIVASLQAVGLVLVVAMLVTPGATAYLLSRRLATMMVTAAGLGLVSAVGGLYGSYHLDVASGPAIVIVASLLFVLAFLLAPRHGQVGRARRRRRAARRSVEEDLLKAVFSAARRDSEVSVDTLAGGAGLAPPAARAGLRRLARDAKVRLDGRRVRLTSTGESEALRVVRAHRLLERYLHDAEGVGLPDVHATADLLEHELSPAGVDDIDRLLGRPTRDPHGHPIPSSSGALARIAGHRLSEQEAGAPARVAMVGDVREDLLVRMVDLGIVPRRSVTVLHRGPGRVRARVGDREVDVPADVAERVFVVPDPAVTAPPRAQGAGAARAPERQGRR